MSELPPAVGDVPSCPRRRADAVVRGRELLGVSAVVPTVFDDSGPDIGAVGRVADHLISGEYGVEALTALGAASETWALSDPQRASALLAVVDAADGRVPVLVGVAGELEQALETACLAAVSGASHLLVRLPDGARTSASAAGHLRRLHDESGLPLVLQDLPVAGESGLASSVIITLVDELAPLVGVKLEGSNSGPTVSKLSELPVPVIAGWGGANLPDRLRRGASACMPGAGTAKAFVRLMNSWETDEVAGEVLYRQLLPLISYSGQSSDLMVVATKRILMRLGVIDSACTVPAVAEPDALQLATVDELIEELLAAGLFGDPKA